MGYFRTLDFQRTHSESQVLGVYSVLEIFNFRFSVSVTICRPKDCPGLFGLYLSEFLGRRLGKLETLPLSLPREHPLW